MWSLRVSAFISLTLHVVLAAITLWHPHLRWKKKLPPPAHRSVIVDFVKIGPKSGAPMLGTGGTPTAKSPPKKTEPLQTSTVKPKPASKPTPQPQAKSDKKAIGKPQSAVSKKSERAAKKTPPKEAASSKSKPSSKASPKGVEKAKVNLAPNKAQASSVGDFLNHLSHGGTGGGSMAETYAEELTGTEMDLLNRHMKRFWNIPSGHEKAYELIVEVELFIRPDRTIEHAQLVDDARAQKDPEFRLAAECALRAVLDPECSPLPLPPDRYESWKHMIFVFDPRDMCN